MAGKPETGARLAWDVSRDEETAPGLSVPVGAAEAVRHRLKETGLLALHLAPLQLGARIAFPLLAATDAPGLDVLLAELPEAMVTVEHFPVRAGRGGDYRDLLAGLPGEVQALLPRAHDVVGDIAVLKLPDAILEHKAEIAAAVLRARPGISTVALDRGVKGPFRVRDLEVVAGEPRLHTLHREHGIVVEVDLARTYFSPRLATERDRLITRIRSGTRVLDLFAGVGALVVRIARERAPAALAAIDLNPDAVRILRRNLERNRVRPDAVDVREGDAREVAPRTRDWDHVVMNLPHDAHRFLDVAAACIAPDGEIHLYAILERDAVDAYVDAARAVLLEETGAAWRLVETRHVRAYSPTMDGLGFTFAAR